MFEIISHLSEFILNEFHNLSLFVYRFQIFKNGHSASFNREIGASFNQHFNNLGSGISNSVENRSVFADISGVNVCTMLKKEKIMLRREMGMIFQSAALFDSMSVLDNVRFPLDMFSTEPYRQRVERAQFCLERVNLADAGSKFPGEISGGMQKRVAIARAIAMQPKYLFCDEPNSGLDPKTSIVIDELIHGITEEFNMTTIVNTHDMNSVMGIGDNILFICDGRAEWQGSNKEIIHSDNKKLNDFIFASDILRKMKQAEEA